MREDTTQPGVWCAENKDAGESGRRRDVARAAGEPIYFTGLPCKFGHRAGRYVTNGTCVECSNLSSSGINKGPIPPKPADGRCEACGEPNRRLVRDHDHTTGDFRGWLCDHCNRGIGQLRDDPVILVRALHYLLSRVKRV